MKFSSIKIFFLSLTTLMIVSGCTEKIKLNLKNADSQIVIEGKVNDQAGPYFVNITKTQNYYDTNAVKTISNALVVITDDAGSYDSLNEVALGKYATHSLIGVPNRNYFLKVTIDGKTYSASSKMPTPVAIDTLAADSFKFGNKVFNTAVAVYRDPAGVANFYKLDMYVNRIKVPGITVYNDRVTDGKIKFSNISPTDGKWNSGDSVDVHLESIDEPVYNYFKSLTTSSNTGPQTVAPTNPATNLVGGCLGYFSAFSDRNKTTKVK